MKILATGACGFIASPIVAGLVALGLATLVMMTLGG